LKITFACPNCAKPLVADEALAGRKGRCRHCGQSAVVPANGQPSRGPKGAPVTDWRTAVASQLAPATGHATAVASCASASCASASRASAGPAADATGDYKLRPVTPVNVPKLAASEWDDAELGPAVDSSLGAIFTTPVTAAPPPAAKPVPTGPSTVFLAYRSFFSLLVRVTTWISETSYTVSFVLIILAVASGMIGRHSLAAMGCGAIVALNLVGLAGDLASLVTLSFRKNPLQGVLFLIPPFTLYYLWSDWQRYRDTVSRMRIPLVMLAVVVAAYMFVPWLHGGKESTGPINESVKRVADALDENLGSVTGAVNEKLKAARTLLREGPESTPTSQPGVDGTTQPAPGQRP
jgi:hypothetical protein